MIDSDGAGLVESEAVERGIDEIIENMCVHLSDKDYPDPDNIKPFFKSQECADILKEYFDERVLKQTNQAAEDSSYYNLEKWAKRVSGLNDVNSRMGIYYLKKKIAEKPKYDILNFLIERQAIVASIGEYTERALKLSKIIYEYVPAQFKDIVGACKETDAEYYGDYLD